MSTYGTILRNVNLVVIINYLFSVGNKNRIPNLVHLYYLVHQIVQLVQLTPPKKQNQHK